MKTATTKKIKSNISVRRNDHAAAEQLEMRIAPAGLILAVYDPATHALTLTGDDLDNKVAIFQTSATTWRVEGRDTFGTDPVLETAINVLGETQFDVGAIAKLNIVTKGGADRVEITNLYHLTAFSADMGAGDDSLKTEGFRVKGNAAFTTGPGVDNIEFDGNLGRITGNLSITDSGDGLTFTFRAERTHIGGNVTYTGSAGVDTLTMTTDTMLTVGKGIDFTANGGNDRLVFGNEGTVAIGRGAQGRSVFYHGGDGNDRIAINSSIVTLGGSVEMDGGNGNDTLDVDGLRVSIGESRAGISVRLNGEAGKDQTDLQGSTLIVAGLIQMDGGAGDDLLDLSSVHRLSLRGGTHFTGGAGFDEFRLGADALHVRGDLFFDGGDDIDEAEVEANGIIHGAITLHLGGATAGDQIAAVLGRSGMRDSLEITGALTVDATGDAAANDDCKLTSLKLGGPLSIKLGEGASTVDMDNVNALAVIIETRGGNDEVVIEGDGNFGISTFRHRTTILLGAGDDTLLIGEGSEDNLVSFRRNVTTDGGEGTDTRNDTAADNEFGDAARFMASAFEVVLPPAM